MDAIENPSRPWQDIARELAREPRRNRVLELAEELNRAMAEQMCGQELPSCRRAFRVEVDAKQELFLVCDSMPAPAMATRREMDAIHHENALYWAQGSSQSPEARSEYLLRTERLNEIRAELAGLRD